MGKYEDITKARGILDIGKTDTLKNIKDKFNKLIKVYHPDVCKEPPDICKKKSEEIISAYKIIMDYCDNYKFSFEKEEVMKYLSNEEFWEMRFGDDPMWSNK